jgi:hypothetical protein
MMHCAVFVKNRTVYRAVFADYYLQKGTVKNISNSFGGIRGHYVSTNKRNGI